MDIKSVATSEDTTAATTQNVTATSVSTVPVVTIPGPKIKAKAILDGMTLKDKVGQMMISHYSEGMETESIQWGGVIFFGGAFQDKGPDSIKKLMGDLQSMSKFPLVLTVDEEGGTVLRVSRFSRYGVDPFESPSVILGKDGYTGVYSDAIKKSKFLINLGINFNLAPVADVSQDSDSFMYSRSAQKDAEGTAMYVSNVVEAMKKSNIGSSLKHFPGYGENIDTHTDIVVDNNPIEYIEERLLPFKAGISAGANSIMVSHLIVKAIDPDYPSSISKKAHDYIRNKLGFKGVVMTDDLEMQGILKFTSEPEISAVLAGNDMLITADAKRMSEAIVRAVEDGTISVGVIDEAVMRVLLMKINLGLIK